MHIPTFEALIAGKVLESGANKPMIAVCLNLESKERTECVVKFSGAERMSDTHSWVREIFASFIGQRLGLWMAQPVLVHVSIPFIRSMEGHQLYSIAAKSLGLNFGTIYVSGLKTPALTAIALREQMQSCIAFDLFIDNSDRSHSKPNCLTDGERLFLFDHELAFAFSLLIFPPSAEEWISCDEKTQAILTQFYFYRAIKGHPFPKTTLLAIFTQLTDAFWDSFIEFLPEPLRGSYSISLIQKMKERNTRIVEMVNCIEKWMG